MKRLTREHFITFAVLVASIGGGVVLGGNSSSGRGLDGELEQPSRGKSRLTALSTSGESFASPVVAEVAEFKGYDPGLSALLRVMPLAEFPAVAELLVGRYRDGTPVEFPTQGIRRMLEIWGERDPVAALAWYETDFPVELGRHVREGIFLGWGRSDPEEALAYIETEVGASGWADGFVRQVFNGMSVTDPELALIRLEDFPLQSKDLEQQLGFAIGRYHPVRCVEFLEKIPEASESRKAIVESMLLGIGDSETLVAVTEVLPDVEKRGYGFIEAGKKALNREVSQLSGREFLESYLQAEGDASADQRELVLAMAETQPQKMIQLMEEMQGEIPSSFVRAVGEELRTSYMGAELKQSMLKGLLSVDGVAPRDVEEVMKRLGTGSVMGHRVLDLVADLDGEVKRHATVGLLDGVASKSIERALESFEKVEDAATRDQAAEVIAEKWVDKEPMEAVAWAGGQGRGAIRAAISRWTHGDPTSASEWVAAIPKGSPGRDSSIAGLVKGLGESESLDEAMIWFEEIGDMELRESLREELRGGISEAEFDLEIEEVRKAIAEEELDADEGISRELEAQYRRLYFGK